MLCHKSLGTTCTITFSQVHVTTVSAMDIMIEMMCIFEVLKCTKGLNVSPIALRMAKTLWSFGLSECSRAKQTLTLLVISSMDQ